MWELYTSSLQFLMSSNGTCLRPDEIINRKEKSKATSYVRFTVSMGECGYVPGLERQSGNFLAVNVTSGK